MLVDEQDTNILPLTCELVECSLDSSSICLRVYDKEVLLRVWRVGDMLSESVCRRYHLKRVIAHTPMPASKRPVTES